jgi:hypothetical protein
MHRMQIAGARIGALMQIAKSNKRGIRFKSWRQGYLDMQTLYAND